MHEKRFPVELEELVRALWEQRMNVLASQLSDDATATFSSYDMFLSDSEVDNLGSGIAPISLSTMPKLQETLAICYMGLYLLRQPIFVGDLVSWVGSGELLYYRAFDTLPEDMRERMDPSGLRRTRGRSVIKADRLQSTVYRLIRGYHKEFGMEIPPINFPLYLYRFIQDLALPLEVYPAVKKLASLLGYTFEYPTSGNRTDRHLLPDRKLAALVVVAVKLMYPFDKRLRAPKSTEEPAAAVVDWDKWVEDRKILQRKLTYEDGMKVTELDALYMDNTELDRYMDWFGDNMVETRNFMIGNSDDTFVQHILAMFPVDDRREDLGVTEEIQDNKLIGLDLLKKTQINLIVRKPVGENSSSLVSAVDRPGSHYRRYRPNEESPDGNMKTFLLVVAELVGMKLEALIAVVFKAELGVEKWARSERVRAAKASEPQDQDDDND
jgi:RNA polymerase I-specific transcription initiation factor RRN7